MHMYLGTCKYMCIIFKNTFLNLTLFSLNKMHIQKVQRILFQDCTPQL